MLSPTPSILTVNDDCEMGLKSPMDESKYYKYEYIVEGMTCAACSCSIEAMLKSHLEGPLKAIKINLQEKIVCIESGEILNVERVVNLIQSAGFKVTGSSNDWRGKLEARRRAEINENERLKWQFLKIILFSLPVLFFQHFSRKSACIFSAPLHFYAAKDIYCAAMKTSCMERLIAISAASSLLYSILFWNQHGLFDCAAIVLLVSSGGSLLQNHLKQKITGIKNNGLLLNLPKVVKSRGIGVHVNALEIGQLVDLSPGDLVPVDGRVAEIYRPLFVDESTFTGESLPRRKLLDDQIFAGSKIENGFARIRMTRLADESNVIKLAQKIYESSVEEKPESESTDFIDEIVKIFIPAILLMALGTFLIWMATFYLSGPAKPKDLIPEWRNSHKFPSTGLSASIYFALTVICVACPCSLALAAPLAVSAVKIKALKRRILIRDPHAFQSQPNRAQIMLFDKTGTLTSGKPEITFDSEKILPDWFFEACQEIEAAVLESQDHPIAQAIYNYCRKINKPARIFNQSNQAKRILVENLEIIPGTGLKCQIIRNANNVSKVDILKPTTGESAQSSSSIVWIDGEAVGKFSWEDGLEDAALDVLNYFKLTKDLRLGIISGDSQAAVERTASKFLPGTFSYVFGDCSPDDKARIVQDLRDQGFQIGVCGDGLNDSLAMSRAHFSISLDSTASSIPSTVSILKLGKGTLSLLPEVFKLSNQMRRKIWLNTVWAVGYNLVTIPLAMGMGIAYGLAPIGPEIGALLMAFSGISIIISTIIF